MTTDPKLEKPPTTIHRHEPVNQASKTKRLRLLNKNLRRHITEGASEIRGICEEYVDIFHSSEYTVRLHSGQHTEGI
jgi:hypothetical protein